MKAFFSYYGGKQKMAPRIIKLIPDHKIYVEPFAGGGAVLATIGWKRVKNNNHYRAVLNDTNGLIYNFYKQLRNNRVEFLELLEFTPYSQRLHSEAIKVCKNPEGYNDLTLAYMFYVNISMGFSNILNHTYSISRRGQNHAVSFKNRVDKLYKLSDLLKNCYITNIDALSCIKKLDTHDTFFYIDPPYVGVNQGHYAGYTQEDLDSLIGLLKDIKGSFILSGYENPAYPDTWERIEIQTSAMSAYGGDGAGKPRRTEVILRKLNQTSKETNAKNQTFQQITVDP